MSLALGEPGRATPNEVDGFTPLVERNLQQVSSMECPARVAGGDQDVTGPGRYQIRDAVGFVGAVQDEQPAPVRLTAGQCLAYGANAFAVLPARLQTQCRGELGQAFTECAELISGRPPHHVVLGSEAVDVLGGQLGLADP